jgi:23S rRNA pseudouridine2604 synthase
LNKKPVTKKTKEPVFPMRINKYLAREKYGTRREADELVSTGQVTINGRLAVLGDKVWQKDKVEVRRKRPFKARLYFAYNKPQGIITHSPQDEEKAIKDLIKRDDIFPVGRLDKDSEGLIILTNDGRVTDRLLNPEYDHEKEYIVRVGQKLASNFKRRMEAGVDIEGYMTKKCVVEPINDFVFKVVLTEGKKHQIRRMCAALGYTTSDLKRTRIGNIRLGNLKSGEYRELRGSELQLFLNYIGL